MYIHVVETKLLRSTVQIQNLYYNTEQVLPECHIEMHACLQNTVSVKGQRSLSRNVQLCSSLSHSFSLIPNYERHLFLCFHASWCIVIFHQKTAFKVEEILFRHLA